MKSKTTLLLFSTLILIVDYSTIVSAVTDAELEALEDQIEQQELEEKQRAESEVKRKAEEKRKAEVKAEKKRLVEIEKQSQEKQRQLAEIDRQRQEEEAKKKVEEKKKEKYTLFVAEAEQAISNKDKELAISKYEEAIGLYPDDVVATLGIKNAEKLKHKLCYDVLGKWIYENDRETIILHEDGTMDYIIAIEGSGSWECTDPENRVITLRVSAFGFSNEWLSEYSADGSCLLGPESWGGRSCYHR